MGHYEDCNCHKEHQTEEEQLGRRSWSLVYTENIICCALMLFGVWGLAMCAAAGHLAGFYDQYPAIIVFSASLYVTVGFVISTIVIGHKIAKDDDSDPSKQADIMSIEDGLQSANRAFVLSLVWPATVIIVVFIFALGLVGAVLYKCSDLWFPRRPHS